MDIIDMKNTMRIYNTTTLVRGEDAASAAPNGIRTRHNRDLNFPESPVPYPPSFATSVALLPLALAPNVDQSGCKTYTAVAIWDALQASTARDAIVAVFAALGAFDVEIHCVLLVAYRCVCCSRKRNEKSEEGETHDCWNRGGCTMLFCLLVYQALFIGAG